MNIIILAAKTEAMFPAEVAKEFASKNCISFIGTGSKIEKSFRGSAI